MSDTGLRVLVVDDEKAIRRYLRTSLTALGYEVLEAANGNEALQATMTAHPDILVLDLGLPDMDGVEVVRHIREWSNVPILILSVRDREDDKVVALDAGADDYLTKPFGIKELLARIRVAIRHHTPGQQDTVFEVEDLRVDLGKREVFVQGNRVALTPTEYDLIKVLVQHAGRVLTHSQLLRQVWGPAYENEAHLLRVNISNLRRKIEPNPDQPRYILTEPGVGYRLRED